MLGASLLKTPRAGDLRGVKVWGIVFGEDFTFRHGGGRELCRLPGDKAAIVKY